MVSVAELKLVIVGKDSTKEAFDSAGKNASDFNSKLEKGLKGSAVVGGAAIVTLGAAMGGVANDFHTANNTFQTDLGVSGEKAKELGEVAKTVFKDNFGANATDAAGVISQAFQQMGDVGKTELTSITENAFRLQDAFGVDTAEGIDAAKTLMENFGLTSQEAFDLLASGYQKGLNRSDDFLDTIGEYSTQFSNGGASAEQFFSLMESGMQGGMLGTDKAADAFKEFRVRIQDGSKGTAEALESLGIPAEDFLNSLARGEITAAQAFETITSAIKSTENPTVKLQAGVALIGTQYEDLGQAGVDAMTLQGQGFANAEGAALSLDAQYNTIGSRLEGFKRKAELALLPLTSKAAEALPVLGQLGASMSGLAPMAALVGPAFASMSSTAVPAIKAMGMALITPPLGIVIAIAAVLVAAYLFRDEIAAVFTKAWDKIEPVVKAMTKGITGGFEKVLDFAKDNWPEIAMLISGPFMPIVALATDAFGIRSKLLGAWGSIMGGTKTAWGNTVGVVTGAMVTMKNGVVSKGGEIVTFFVVMPGKMVGALGDTGKLLWNAGAKIVTGLVNGMKSKVGDVTGFLGGLTNLIPIKKGPPATDAMLLEPNGRLIIQGLVAGMEAEVPTVTSLLADLTTDIDHAGTLLGQAAAPVDALSAGFEGLRASLQEAVDADALEAISAIGGAQAVSDYNAATSALAALGSEYATLGGQIDIAQTAVDGLKTQLDAATAAANRFKSANIAEAAPFDAASAALDRQMAQIELAINKLKQQGPLTKELTVTETSASGKVTTSKKTVDTDIGKQVKALEGNLESLRLKAQQVDLEKELEIGPLEDQIASLTNTTETIPFADIIAGLQGSQSAIATLTPQWETQNGQLEVLKTRYGDIGTSMEGLETSISSMVNLAVQEFGRMNAEADALATSMASAAAESSTSGESIGSSFTSGISAGLAAGEPDVLTAVDATCVAVDEALTTGFEEAGPTSNAALSTVLGNLAITVARSILPSTTKTLANEALGEMNNQLAEDAPPLYSNFQKLIGGMETMVVQSPMPTYMQQVMAGTITAGTGQLAAGETPFQAAGQRVMGALTQGIADGGVAAQTTLNTVISGLITAANSAKTSVAAAVGNIAAGFGNRPPGRANGGPVRAGEMYMVGERGPELFVSGQSGSIVPNDKLGGGGAAGLTVNTGPITIYNTGKAKDAHGTLDDWAFGLGSALRRRGLVVPV